MTIDVINKYFVVSPPRSGTSSLCEMASIVGLRYMHAPVTSIVHVMNPGMPEFYARQFIADTPVFRPSFIESVMDSDKNKFIYCDRSSDIWVKSFERVNLHEAYIRMRGQDNLNHVQRLDRDSLAELFDNKEYSTEMAMEAHGKHKRKIITTLRPDQLLIYDFSMGWNPFCEFLGVDVPNVPLPHRNNGTIFDPLPPS